MERLAALIPRPKIHLTRYHGVLAPHYKFRKQIVKQVVPIGSKAKTDSLVPSQTIDPLFWGLIPT
ncbi:MAG: transposase [Bdellovibrionales bacterium]|nr:transposase [Bdellovibrionales bacterium]